MLLYKIHEALDNEMMQHMTDSTDEMISAWTDPKLGEGDDCSNKPTKPGKLACPSKNDHRHLNIDRQIEKHGANDVGVLHLGYWIPNQQNPSGVAVSSDSIKKNYGFRAFSAYQRDLQDFYQVSCRFQGPVQSTLMLIPTGCLFVDMLQHHPADLSHLLQGL